MDDTNRREIDLTRFAAVVNADGPHAGVSDRYAFIPTTRVIDILGESGWFPVSAQESRVRSEDRRGVQKHIVRLENRELTRVGGRESDVAPQILLRNTHDRTGTFELRLGLFRFVCANGLVAGDSFERYRVRHVGYADEAVEEAARLLTAQAPRVLDMVERMRAVPLTSEQQRSFAQSAIELKFDGSAFALAPGDILHARRLSDSDNSLWSTLNRVQESLIKGGARGRNQFGDVRRDRAVTAIHRNIALNQSLWNLAETFIQ